MKKIIVLLFVVVGFSSLVNSQDIIFLNSGNIYFSKLQYDTNYNMFLFDNNGMQIPISKNSIRYLVVDYKQMNKGRYLIKATRLYNTSMILSVASIVPMYAFPDMDTKNKTILSGIIGLGAIITHISANQQFKKAGKLMEIELAADRVGVKIKF